MDIREIDKDNLKLINQYLENLARLNKSPHTIKNYEADLKKFSLWLKHAYDEKLDKVNGEVIGHYKDFLSGIKSSHETLPTSELSDQSTKGLFSWFKNLISGKTFKPKKTNHRVFLEQGMSVSSKRRHLSSLKNFFEYLKEGHEDHSKKFQKNPVKSKIHAITLKEIDVTPTSMISVENFKKIDEKIYRTQERLIIYLMYYGGLRLSELTFLKISNFDFKTKSLTFNRKGGYVHTLMIQKEDKIFKNLQYYLDHTSLKSDFLFQNNRGLPLTPRAMNNKINKIIERAIPDNAFTTKITPHSFRKACATNLYLKSKDLLLVRDYLNHKDAKVTQTYIDKATLAKVRKRYH